MNKKHRNYRNTDNFVRLVSQLVLGQHALDGQPVSFAEVASMIGVTAASLRMRKSDPSVMNALESKGITTTKIKNANYFIVTPTEK